MKKITVLAVDDHPLALAGVEKILEQVDDIEIIGQAANGEAALEKIAELRPQVLLLDLKMPGMPAREVEKWTREHYPEIVTITLTAHDRDYYLAEMMEAGVAAYIDKNSRGEQLIASIRRVANGETLFTKEQIERVKTWRTEIGPKWDSLSDTERDVLRLMVKGLTNPQIAELRDVAERTVVFHVSNILRKLDVETRQAASAWAVEHIPDMMEDD
mgnify:CR=1 FL=1